MCSKELLLLACLFLLRGLRLTSTTTTTTFVAAMSIANQDLDRYFRTANATQILAKEERILIDTYTYAFLNYTYRNDDNDDDIQTVSFDEEKARYGEGHVADCYRGKLVHISNEDDVTNDTACTPNILGTNHKQLPPRGVTWIALVKRGHCTFEQKVKHVHAHGACGVIIYNDKLVNSLEKMQIKDQTRNITAVITYLDIGLEMARIADQEWLMEVSIIRGRSGHRPINTLNKTSVLFVSISFIVLMVISLVWLLFYYIQRFRYLQTKDQHSRQLCSVTKKAIMKIPTKTGKTSDEKDLDSDCCAICIEAYKPSDCIRVLPCKHEFHKNCIDPWLIEHRTCPMCKLDVLKFYGYVVGDQIHPTPSPQYVPPNIDNLDGARVGGGGGSGVENDVEVIAVALAPPYSAAQPTATTQAQQQPNANVMQQTATQITQLPVSRLSTTTTAATTHAQQQPHTQLHTHTHINNCNCSNANSSASNRSDNASCCLQQRDSSAICQQHSCEHTRNNNTSSSGTSAHIMRRNSAPLVLQVSTASHKVTDV